MCVSLQAGNYSENKIHQVFKLVCFLTYENHDVGINLPDKTSHSSCRLKQASGNVVWHESNIATQEVDCFLQGLSYEGRGDGQGVLAHTHVDSQEGGQNWSIVWS